MYEVIIVGGGPAGLSAALILGRSLRKVLLVDNGKPRNAYSHALHGYLTRDGLPPGEFLSLGRKELAPYENVTIVGAEVTHSRKTEMGFAVTLVDGSTHAAKKLLIATGVMDNVPKIENIMDFYGTSVHTCAYCDGWENRGKPIAVYGKAERGLKSAISLRNWSDNLILFTDGPSGFNQEELQKIKRNGIQLNENKISRLEGHEGKLENIVLEDGTKIHRVALFFNTESFIRSKLLEQLGCSFDNTEGVYTGKYEMTDVHGLYVAGNICREVQLVIVAAAEGAEAAFGINTALTKEEHT